MIYKKMYKKLCIHHFYFVILIIQHNYMNKINSHDNYKSDLKKYKTTVFKKNDLEKLEMENKKAKQKMIYNTYKIDEEIRKTKIRLKILQKEKENILKIFENDKLNNFKKIFFDKLNKNIGISDIQTSFGGETNNNL